MKQRTRLHALLSAIVMLCLVTSASAALVTVSSTEEWDGIANPHAADGVTITGSGTDEDPWVYNIPNGMHITATGRIKLWSASHPDQPIKFLISGGDLQMDAGAVLNIERYKTRTGWTPFIIDMDGINSITGAGTIGPITDRDSTPRDLTIENVRNVSLADIDMHVENANTGPLDFRSIKITASGAVYVSGTVDNADRDSGGDGSGDIIIRASTIDVNNLDARGFRNDPPGRAPYSGNVWLQALSPLGNYDPNDGVNNTSANRLTVRGAIRTMAVDQRTLYGNVTLQGVVLQLVLGVIEVPPDAVKTLEVGELQGGASADDLFVNVSSSGETAANVIQWAAPFAPPSGSQPAFGSDPVLRADANGGQLYAQTLVGTATDPDVGDTLTFGRSITGPAWLQVASNGTLSGTPALTDSGTNTWPIWVSDGTRFDTATLQIFVANPPRWNDGDANFAYQNAEQNVPYANTLATNVIYYGSQTLTFAKVSGPDWLTVAPDGQLSGTPSPTNVLNNVFVVSVSDGTTPVPATLNIFVNGSPAFPLDPFIRATSFVGNEYALRTQTLAGAATDPQDPNNPATLEWAKVSGPAWLIIAADGSLSGTPGAGDAGVNTFTVSAANAYPATTATMRINVAASVESAPVEVVTREYWDGVQNPHAAEGVTLTGAGTAEDPATYTVPRGLYIYSSGQIYTSQPLGDLSEAEDTALHIKFTIEGDLTMDAQNNALVTAIHARNAPAGQKNLILDLNGTNSIVGQGRILGLGNRVNAATFPDCFNNDTPRILTITNVNDVSLYDINVQVRNANNWGRPLLIRAHGHVQVANAIDNSDRDTGGDGGCDVTVVGKTVTVNTIRSDSFRTDNFRNVGNITLRALAPPDFNPADGVNNNSNHWITVTGNLRASTPQANTTWGTITTESVVLELTADATLNNGANDITSASKLNFNAGQIKNGAVAADLFRNRSASQTTGGAPAANYVVDWSGTVPPVAPASPTLLVGSAAPGQIVLSWSGNGFLLQQNSDLTNPSGWVPAPSGTANPATNAIGAGNLFYRLKWPQ
ncbi:MAG TPA: putative Ig domain-containing protein [Verrucomicrobiota bacterium]|nr:putative Ig domain-containing protein [Verrucomicrobiota bacterium]